MTKGDMTEYQRKKMEQQLDARIKATEKKAERYLFSSPVQHQMFEILTQHNLMRGDSPERFRVLSEVARCAEANVSIKPEDLRAIIEDQSNTSTDKIIAQCKTEAQAAAKTSTTTYKRAVEKYKPAETTSSESSVSSVRSASSASSAGPADSPRSPGTPHK